MNILVLSYEYPPIGGGGGIGARQYAEEWVKEGHRVRVLTSAARGLEQEETVNGVEVVRVAAFGRKDRATASFISMLSYNIVGVIHIAKHLGAYRRFDILNTHFSLPTGPMASVAARLLHRPNVLTIIGGDIHDPTKRFSPHRIRFLRMLNRRIIDAADRVVAISNDTRARAESLYGIRRSIRVIHYGFRPPRDAPRHRGDAHPVDLDPDKFHVIAVGRLIPRKGFEYLIRAIALLPEDIALVLIGDGPLEDGLRGIAREEGVVSRVRMLGFRTRREIYRYLHGSDCFVLPSLHEGLGIVVQEAMDCGLPVVATDEGGQRDLVVPERNGILVKPADPDALAEAIRRIHDDPELAARLARNNLVDIRKFYEGRNSRLYLELFDELVSEATEGSTRAA